MMDPIYQIGDEKNVRAFVAFGKEADGKLYEDKAFEIQVAVDEAQNAFEKGMLLVDIGNSGLVTPVDFVDGSVVVLKYTADDGSTAASVAPVAFTCKAAE